MTRGEPWGSAATRPPDVTGSGDDADLAALVARHPGALVAFDPGPGCDLARAVGLAPGARRATALPVDALRVVAGDGAGDRIAVNLVVVGVPPDRVRRTTRSIGAVVELDGRTVFDGDATSVVVANGQFLRGLDVAPRGHPGDGRLEVQVYAVPGGDRRAMRRRLASGTHVPHPGITTVSGREVRVRTTREAPVEADGAALPPAGDLAVTVVPEAFQLLV